MFLRATIPSHGPELATPSNSKALIPLIDPPVLGLWVSPCILTVLSILLVQVVTSPPLATIVEESAASSQRVMPGNSFEASDEFSE